jgi:hypothetical protein
LGQRGPSRMMKVGMLVLIPCGLNVSIYSQAYRVAIDALPRKRGI